MSFDASLGVLALCFDHAVKLYDIELQLISTPISLETEILAMTMHQGDIHIITEEQKLRSRIYRSFTRDGKERCRGRLTPACQRPLLAVTDDEIYISSGFGIDRYNSAGVYYHGRSRIGYPYVSNLTALQIYQNQIFALKSSRVHVFSLDDCYIASGRMPDELIIDICVHKDTIYTPDGEKAMFYATSLTSLLNIKQVYRTRKLFTKLVVSNKYLFGLCQDGKLVEVYDSKDIL